eukprot:m.85643 g.85643  ORF g.85643 m.85643 type:complete len:1340 (-) comp25887_c0_seq1:274-4293(-)
MRWSAFVAMLELVVACLVTQHWSVAAQVDVHLYEMFGVSTDASPKQLREAYGTLCSERHPTKIRASSNSSSFANELVDLQLAFKTLKDDELRYLYNTFGRSAVQTQQNNSPTPDIAHCKCYQKDFLKYSSTPNIEMLESDILSSIKTAKKQWLVLFVSTSPQCQIPKSVFKIMKTLALEVQGIINVGVYDCYTNAERCQELQIDNDQLPLLLRYGSYPQIKVAMTATSLTLVEARKFALRGTHQPLELDVTNFAVEITKQNQPYVLVVYYKTLMAKDVHLDLRRINALMNRLNLRCAMIECEKNQSASLCDEHRFKEPSVWVFSQAMPRHREWKMIYVANKTTVGRERPHEQYSFSTKNIHLALLRLQPLPRQANALVLSGDEDMEPHIDAMLVFFVSDSSCKKSKMMSKLARDMNSLRSKWSEGGRIGVTMFKCVDANVTICKNVFELDSNHLPEIRLYKHDGYETYYGPQATNSLTPWILHAFHTKVVNIQINDLPDKINRGEKWLIYMHSATCEYCQKTLPIFRDASVYKPYDSEILGPEKETSHSLVMRGGGDIKFGTLDCGKNKQLCLRLQVNTVPAVIYYDLKLDSGHPPRYFGSLTNAREMHAFSLHSARPDALQLDDVALRHHLGSTRSLWMFMFTAGAWCGPCTQVQPIFLEAGQLLHGIVKTGFLDCDVHTSFCNQLGITAYPLIRFYGANKKDLSTSSLSPDYWMKREAHDYEYEKAGDYSAENIANWISSKLPDKVMKLSQYHHNNKVVQDTTVNWLVLYTSSTNCTQNSDLCTSYEDTHRRVAYLLRYEDVKVGSLDCSKFRTECDDTHISEYPTILLYVRPTEHQTTIVNIPVLSVSATVSWVRNYLPPIATDTHVSEVLHYFYQRYDPACKSPYELEAISNKFLGKKHKLYKFLEEKYGENPLAVYKTIHEYGLEYAYHGPSVWVSLGSVLYGLHDPTSTSELVFVSVFAVLLLMMIIELPFLGKLNFLLPTKKERTILLVGVHGTVGAGVATAFRDAGWTVIGVDPIYKGSPYSGTEDDYASTIEAVPDMWLQYTLKRCTAVVYVADSGNKIRYQTVKGLGTANNKRFRVFCERCRSLLGSHACTWIVHIGGSWTKRKVVDGASLIVTDDSYSKPNPANHYEAAKIEAEAMSKQVSEELDVFVSFFDWITVVPNFDSDFIIAKMTREAMGKRSLNHPIGDHHGLPLLHSRDAGLLLLAYVEQHITDIRKGGSLHNGSKFHSVLMPGVFTTFSSFAEIIKNTLFELELENDSDPQLVQPIMLVEQDIKDMSTPRCESRIFEDLSFTPDAAAITEGLRSSCISAWNKEQLQQRSYTNSLESKSGL